MRHEAIDQPEAWHRNPWVWLVIAIPAMTVLGCMLTIYLAITNPDYLVRDAVAESATPESSSRDASP
jgi:hypothetical protein